MIPDDKVLHLATGFVGGFVLTVGLAWGGASPTFRVHAAIGLSLSAGIGKETLDYLDNERRKRMNLQPQHSVEGMDAVATFAGVMAGHYVAKWVLGG